MFRSCAVPAMQADYFRYCAVLAEGGIYCDVGYRCIAPLETLLGDCESGGLFQRADGAVVNGFFAFSAPGHPLLELTLEVATANVERRAGEHAWQITGPAIFTGLHMLCRFDSLDAFVARCATLRKGNLRVVAESLKAIGVSPARAASALDGVTIQSLDRLTHWFEQPGFRLPYKDSAEHWLHFDAPIFERKSSKST